MGSLSPKVSAEPEIIDINNSPGFDVENNGFRHSNFSDSDRQGLKTLAVFVQGACKEYLKGVPVLNQLNMQVEKGSIYSLLGSSGCGKTTILSCMIGLRRLDSGVIRIFGKQPGDPDSGIPGKALGYMPQEIALFQTLRIREILLYFGRLYGMTSTEIKAETQFLANFLNLPDASNLIKNLSGGEQRRTSLALAMLHKPELLILDEPTVGVDPLIRESIWEHLKDLVSKRKTTILITTHYIEEARESGKVGVMRNGRLLAEKSPKVLLEEHNEVLLETVVLKLCGNDTGVDFENLSAARLAPVPTIPHNEPDICFASPSTQKKGFSTGFDLNSHLTKVLSLVIRNYINLIRTPWFPIVLILIPTIHLILFNIVLRNEPKETKLGVLNKELPQVSQANVMEFCKHHSHGCLLNFTSCKYFNRFPEEDIKWISYTSEEAALKGVRAGEVWGYISIPENYTTRLTERVLSGKFSEPQTILGSTVGVKLDVSDYLKTNFIRQKLLVHLEQYWKQIASECDLDPRQTEIPLKFKSVYGEGKPGYIEFLQPAQLSLVIFMLPMTCALTYISDRKSGTLDRSLVAGVKHFHFLIAYLITEGFMIFIELALSFAIYYLAFDFSVKGSFILYWAITYLQGIIGLSIGFFIAVICDREIAALQCVIAVYLPIMVSSGGNWPVVGLSTWATIMCSLLPNTWPMEAMRSIISKGWGLSHPHVWRSFALGFGWIVGVCLLCAVVLRIKRN